jgi:hypothetical protein
VSVFASFVFANKTKAHKNCFLQLSGGSSEWGADAADDDAVMLGTMSTARTMPGAPPGEGTATKGVSFPTSLSEAVNCTDSDLRGFAVRPSFDLASRLVQLLIIGEVEVVAHLVASKQAQARFNVSCGLLL